MLVMLGASYKLIVDIALSKAWNPIGDKNTPFSGTFDGNNRTISGLNISRIQDYVGLFGYIEQATIKNLTIVHTGIGGVKNIGALAGYALDSRIENVNMQATNSAIVSGDSSVGGLAGHVYGGIVSGSAAGPVKGTSKVGGLVGYANGTTNGYATGNVCGTDNIGGLVGYTNGNINGYARGTTTRSSGDGTSFGLLIGGSMSFRISITGNHSATESSYGDIADADTKGVKGTAITVEPSTEQSAFSFTIKDETNTATKWIWVEDGKWPVINIDLLKPASE